MKEEHCPFCKRVVDPLDRYSWQRITAWHRSAGTRRSGKHGGSDVALRKPEQEWAHPGCIKLAQDGFFAQETLL
jgi:hypothetical protein